MARKYVIPNSKFHKLLDIFSDEVHTGKYKKLYYDTYRKLRKMTSPEIVIEYNRIDTDVGTSYRAIDIMDGKYVHSIVCDDNSFGDFLYNEYFKEDNMHPEEKKVQYNMFGDIIGEYTKYEADCARIDDTAKSAWLDYCATQALEKSYDSISTGSISTSDQSLTWDDSNSHSGVIAVDPIKAEYATKAITAELSTCHTEIKTGLEVATERIDDLQKDIDDVYNVLQTKSDKSAVDYEVYELRKAYNSLVEKDLELQDLIFREGEKAYYDVSALEETIYDEIAYHKDEFERQLGDLETRIKELEENNKGLLVVPPEAITTQSTSSNCYPKKNFKINIAEYGTDDRKENENMDTNKMFNFDFGPVASHIRMSPYGLAIKSADNKFVSYDKASGSVVDVEVFNFDAQKFLYKMPVPVSQVAIGDVVVHMRKPMFVREVKGNVVSVVDIYNAEAKDILPVKSPFGFNFITKIVSLIDVTGADANSPFGNMLPLLMMGEGQDFKDILPLMMFANGGNVNMLNNPLMMYALLSNNNNTDSLGLFLALTSGLGNNSFAPAATIAAHNCGCNGTSAN